MLNTKIPKLIHQIFYPFYFDEMPQKWINNAQVWRQMHPDYEYKLWGYDDSLKFLQEFYPHFVETWLNYKHNIQKCDAIRYFILYHYGGIYADLDLVPLKPIDNLLVYEMLIPESTVGGGFSNSFLACKQGHQFFETAMYKLPETINKFWFLGKHLNVMYSTGPAFVTNINKEYTGTDTMFVICSKVYYGNCNACSDTSNTCKGYLFGHTDGKSWNRWDTKLLNHLYCNYKNYLIAILIIIIVVLWYYGFYRKCRIKCSR